MTWWRRLPRRICVSASDSHQQHQHPHPPAIREPATQQGKPGTALALEHNGDLYSCDHFVEPAHLLGNITERHMLELVASPQQQAFGNAKRDSLPGYCRRCDVRFACNGGCPTDRFATTPDGEAGLHYLCPSYQAFLHHVDGPMRVMAAALRTGHTADEVMAWCQRQDDRIARQQHRFGRDRRGNGETLNSGGDDQL